MTRLYTLPPAFLARAVGALLLLALAAAPAQGASQDALFLAAREAFRAGQAAKVAEYGRQLKGYVLAPYVEYYSLKLRLEDAAPGEVSDFLNRNADSYVSEQLRRDWLKLLGKRGDWDLFDVAAPLLVSEDADVTCYALQSRWRKGDLSAVEDLKRVWHTPRDLPDGCVAIAEAQISTGFYTTRDIWERVRLLLNAGQLRPAGRTIGYLPAAEAPAPKLIDRIYGNPQHYLDKPNLDVKKPANREMLVFALTRAAQKDPDRAIGYWTRGMQARFTETDQQYVWAQLALNGAKRHMPEALAWYASASGGPMDDEALAWWVRIALRQGKWTDVKIAIAQMTPLGRNDPTWIYWEGRADAALGKPADADALYRRIAEVPSFYGKLALEELGEPLALPPRAEPPSPEELAGANANGGLARGLALFRLDLRPEAVREWNWSLRNMDDRQLLAAAELARRAELWDRAINTADRTVGLHDFGMRFLAPYKTAFSEQARSQGLEESWVLGLVRQESRFIANIRSSAGAAGLMQLMPATARWIAKRIGLKDFQQSQVTDPDVNIALGTGYLKYVLDELDGSPVLAAAAYNAGPGRARRWKADQPLEGAIYAETIPFNETRDYVKQVMSNTVYYAALYGGDARSLKARLGTIPSRAGGEGYAATITGNATVQ